MKFVWLIMAMLLAGCSVSSPAAESRGEETGSVAKSYEDLAFRPCQDDDVTEYSFVKDGVLHEVNETTGHMFRDGLECDLDEESIQMIHALPAYQDRVVPKAFIYQGEMYVDTGYVDGRARCGNLDEFFASTVGEDQLPGKELEKNFPMSRDYEGFQWDVSPMLCVPLEDGFHYFAKKSLRNEAEMPEGVNYVEGQVLDVEGAFCRLAVKDTNDFRLRVGEEVAFEASGLKAQDEAKVYYAFAEEGTLKSVYRADME